MSDKACKNCRFISNGPVCPNCKSTNLSDDWSGLVVIIDPSTSEVAKRMEIKASGRYAIRVR
ncbi:MAG: transcription elongation factor subunit Spt4 [Candidatus Bathyarchaeia archaeon]